MDRKINDSAAKINDSAAKINDSAVKINDSAEISAMIMCSSYVIIRVPSDISVALDASYP